MEDTETRLNYKINKEIELQQTSVNIGVQTSNKTKMICEKSQTDSKEGLIFKKNNLQNRKISVNSVRRIGIDNKKQSSKRSFSSFIGSNQFKRNTDSFLVSDDITSRIKEEDEEDKDNKRMCINT